MKSRKSILLLVAVVMPLTGLVLAAKTSKDAHAAQVTRGNYLVAFGGCNDCHTPFKYTEQGPVPDMSRMLSGHPETVKLPAPDLKPGPWFAATAGMTAWAGPWGVSFAINLTPDKETGIGEWSEHNFIQSLRIGKHQGQPNGRAILPPMPWENAKAMTDDDLKAMFAYLRSIPAVKNQVPLPVVPAAAEAKS